MSVDAVGVHTRRTARVLAEHYPLILLALAYAGIALLARPLLGSHDHQLGKTVLIQTALATGIIVAVVVVILKAASLVGRLTGSPTDWSEVLSPYRIGSASLVLALNGLVMSAFLDFKARIPDIQPFAWDTTLMELDRALHFGHPWTWLSWIPEAGTLALDTVYWTWFTVNLVFVAF
ncbi:MAG TPA: hypothetical protein VFR18_22870, partial [Terriglobia bacterium]|nr:hypothetical protein [Terriglobia bacterium]